MAYASLNEFKTFIRIPVSDTVDDTLLQLALDSATSLIDQHCNRTFGTASTLSTRYFTSVWDRKLRRYTVEIDDLVDLTGIVVADGTYTLYPRNAVLDGKAYSKLVFDSTATPSTTFEATVITAKWGFHTVPVVVENACLLQASRIFKRRDAAFGIAGSPDMGSELRLLTKLDVDVQVLLQPFRRWWAAA